MEYAFETEGLVKRYGKTTAVRILATLLRPDAGRAVVCGLDVVSEAAHARADRADRPVRLGGRRPDRPAEPRADRAAAQPARHTGQGARPSCCATSSSPRRAGRQVKTYSGGMRRRLDLAASLVGRLDVIYLDEPTTELDQRRIAVTELSLRLPSLDEAFSR